jgi:hypothetical protein
MSGDPRSLAVLLHEVRSPVAALVAVLPRLAGNGCWSSQRLRS